MFKDLPMRIFLAHLIGFILGVLICAGVNLWLTPGTLWFPWVLIGWGAAVAIHAFALLLRKTRRRERVFIDKCTRSFAVHLFAYLATILILLFVNVTVTPKVWWFYWIALGWGAGLIAHGWCAFGKTRPRAVPPPARQTKAAAPEPAARKPQPRKPSSRPRKKT
jgi:hypothetical protein